MMLFHVGNLLTLLVLSRVQQMAWATRAFLINLSVSDLLVGVVACMPAIYPSVVGRWTYGATFCQVQIYTRGMVLEWSLARER
jgi:hypothetical protein